MSDLSPISLKLLAKRAAEEREYNEQVTLLAKRILETPEPPRPMSTTTTTTTPATTAPIATPENTTTSNGNPFRKVGAIEKRLKVFCFGDTGSGKTTLALRFPKPAILDFERGAELYGKTFDFESLPVTGADSAATAVDWLLTHEHPYQTLIVDPITVYWEALQQKWSDRYLKYNKGGKGFKHEFYDIQPKDWMAIKAELKSFLRKLLALDMNVIVTAREKPLYEEGAFMKRVGETFDGEKSLPYMFDVVLRLQHTADNRFVAMTLKDRTNKLPKAQGYEISYEVFRDAFGEENLSQVAKPLTFATPEQVVRIRELATAFGMPDDKLRERLETYGATSIDELTTSNAAVIVSKLEAALAARLAKAQQAQPAAQSVVQPAGTTA